MAWDIPGWSQESQDTKYFRIHRLPWHGTSRDGPRNPGILSIPGSMGPLAWDISGWSQESRDTKYSRIHGPPGMGHLGMVPAIPGY